MDKTSKKNLLIKFRKEALVLMVGSTLVLAILVNLQSPSAKTIESETNLTIVSSSDSTRQAAQKVEEEQTKQSLMLSKFKKDYAAFVKLKTCFQNQSCNHSSPEKAEAFIEMTLDELKPQLISNWFRLNQKVKLNVINTIALENKSFKSGVLNLLTDLSVEDSNRHLSLVLEHVVNEDNAELLPKTFVYLKKVSNDENEVQIAKKVVEALNNCNSTTAAVFIREIDKISSPNTKPLFEEAFSKFPKLIEKRGEVLTSSL